MTSQTAAMINNADSSVDASTISPMSTTSIASKHEALLEIAEVNIHLI